MPRDELKNLIEDSKKELEKDHRGFEQSIKDDLESFKKKTLDKI